MWGSNFAPWCTVKLHLRCGKKLNKILLSLWFPDRVPALFGRGPFFRFHQPTTSFAKAYQDFDAVWHLSIRCWQNPMWPPKKKKTFGWCEVFKCSMGTKLFVWTLTHHHGKAEIPSLLNQGRKKNHGILPGWKNEIPFGLCSIVLVLLRDGQKQRQGWQVHLKKTVGKKTVVLKAHDWDAKKITPETEICVQEKVKSELDTPLQQAGEEKLTKVGNRKLK